MRLPPRPRCPSCTVAFPCTTPSVENLLGEKSDDCRNMCSYDFDKYGSNLPCWLFTTVSGTINPVSYTPTPQPPMFIVLSSDSLSLTECNILALIEGKMSERGYQKANSFESANVGVVYKYSIDPAGSVHSYPDSAVGGHGTYTTHLQKSKPLKRSKSFGRGNCIAQAHRETSRCWHHILLTCYLRTSERLSQIRAF